jgi:hypothetical protein
MRRTQRVASDTTRNSGPDCPGSNSTTKGCCRPSGDQAGFTPEWRDEGRATTRRPVPSGRITDRGQRREEPSSKRHVQSSPYSSEYADVGNSGMTIGRGCAPSSVATMNS